MPYMLYRYIIPRRSTEESSYTIGHLGWIWRNRT